MCCPIPWDVSHGIPIGMTLSHPMGCFPWDSHRNDIPMDKPEDSDRIQISFCVNRIESESKQTLSSPH